MPLDIKTAPRLGDGNDALDVFVEWIRRAGNSKVHQPRKGGAPYRAIQVPDAECKALMLWIADPENAQNSLAQTLQERIAALPKEG